MLSTNKGLLNLSNITKDSSNAPRHRVGRGFTRGHRCGRGSEGQKSRSGDANPKTEGGQFPLMLRIKKRGFCTHRTNKIASFNIYALVQYMQKHDLQDMSLEALQKFRKLNKKLKILKIIGCTEELKTDKQLTLTAHKVSTKLQEFLNSQNNINIKINIVQ